MKRPTFKGHLAEIAALAVVIFLMTALPALADDLGFENINTDYQKVYSHFAPAGLHSDAENYKNMPVSQRHANCNDCHDPHSVMATPSPLGSSFGAGTQNNVSGVRAFYSGVAAGGKPTYVFLSAVVKEYELCFKCHSAYSWGAQSLPKFNWTKGRYWQAGDPATDILVQETDPSIEFNPANASYHPVIVKGKLAGSTSLAWAGDVTFNFTFVPGHNANSLIKCTDCHGSNSTTVKGPHGSDNKYVLKKRSPTEEPLMKYTTGPNMGQNMVINGNPIYQRTDDNICYECHDVKYYGRGQGHPSGAGVHGGECDSCHGQPKPATPSYKLSDTKMITSDIILAGNEVVVNGSKLKSGTILKAGSTATSTTDKNAITGTWTGTTKFTLTSDITLPTDVPLAGDVCARIGSTFKKDTILKPGLVPTSPTDKAAIQGFWTVITFSKYNPPGQKIPTVFVNGPAPALDQVGCASCKTKSVHGDESNKKLMKNEDMCLICHPSGAPVKPADHHATVNGVKRDCHSCHDGGAGYNCRQCHTMYQDIRTGCHEGCHNFPGGCAFCHSKSMAPY
jgi:hypothetical protein